MPLLSARRAAVLLVVAALGGCAAAPDGTVPPAVDVPATWQGPVAAQAAPQPIADAWWEAFDSAELSALIVRARKANPDLAASRHRISQARAQARAAAAGLWPTLGADAGATRRWPQESKPSSSFSAGFDAAYEVDLWGGTRAGVAAAEAGTTAARFRHDAAVLSLSADVATTYFQYLSFGDRLASARRILAIAEELLALIEQRERLGAASGLELAQQRAAVASLRASIPGLAQGRAETLNALALLLGTTPGEVTIAAEGLSQVRLPQVGPGLPSDLLARRPDIAAAEARLAAAGADVQVARAALLPSIRLTGALGYSSTELAQLFSPGGLMRSLAAGIAAPLLDGGRLRARRDGAEAARDEAGAQYRAAVLAAFRDVEDALAAAAWLREAEAARREAFAEAERAHALAEARYRAGRTDFLALLDVQRTLFQQEEQLEQARLARLSAAVSLYEALGGGWTAAPARPINGPTHPRQGT